MTAPAVVMIAIVLGLIPPAHAEEPGSAVERYPADRYIVGIGQADLAKGRVVCQRVADLAARAELAKQVQVDVSEQILDRARERKGQPVEQDIEIVREQHVRELLRWSRIVERSVDSTAGTCSSTAVMERSQAGPDDGPAPRPVQ